MNSSQFTELLLQSLEHERGGVKVYQAAVRCAIRDDLRAEWQKYLSQTEEHVSALTELCEVFDIDPFTMTPGVQIVKSLGASLVLASLRARRATSMSRCKIRPRSATIAAFSTTARSSRTLPGHE